MAGYTAPGFEPVARAFRRIVGRREGGGALTVRVRGETVVDLVTGYADKAHTRPWTPETLAISFSTTKGVASTVVHRLADRGQLAYDEPVAAYWPEFAAGGKERVTVRQLLTHRAGLYSVRAVAKRAEDLLDHVALEDKLAARAVRAPTERSAYHAITYGWLVAGLARRITGHGLADLARIEVTEPLGITGLHIGVPAEAREFVAEPVGSALRQLGSTADATQPLWGRYRVSRTTLDALHVPGFHRLFEGSDPPIWHTEMPAVNGVISARALADMYAPLANGGQGFLTRNTVHALGRVQVRTRDAVLGLSMRWRLGYHQGFGSGGRMAFGHYGYGGSGGWADPQTGLSVGFVTNRIGSLTTPLGDLNLFRLNRVVRQCVAARV
ncbi:MAG TPA: serine hydrolase domain-containing protein [Thermoleophilaceae bacterium]|jgi:CubicO group peptidase (beta-lactamase class C family)|nr:serine hydrolase domain-containing protein [Thermoleophilaceae bacterium]